MIAAALRLRLSVRAVRGLLAMVAAGLALPAGSTLFAQQVTTLAGSGQSGSTDGTGTAASFNSPLGVAVGADGAVYVADYSGYKIRKITAAGVVTTLAGRSIPSGYSTSMDGTGTTATFARPTGIAVGADGAVYVADYGSHKIRKITVSGGVATVSTLAGSGPRPGSSDGAGTEATFS